MSASIQCVTFSSSAAFRTVGRRQYWSQLAQGKGVLAEDKLETLMDRLEFEPDERAELSSLRDIAKGRSPYSEYSALFSPSLMRLFGLEAGAQTIRSFENAVIPGLLQSEDYIRTLMKTTVSTGRPTEVEQRVQARLRRQQRLNGPDAVQLCAVIGQAALSYQVGGPEGHRNQLRYLLDLVDRHPDNLDLRVIPFEAGSSIAGLNTATFHLLDFESARLPTVGWVDFVAQGEIVENPTQVGELEYLYEQVHEIALDRDETIELIDKAASRLG